MVTFVKYFVILLALAIVVGLSIMVTDAVLNDPESFDNPTILEEQ
jgi:hypothetical protein